MEVLGKDTRHDVLVDVDAKGSGDLLGDPGTSESGIPAFQINNDLDDFLRRALRARLASCAWREQQPVFPLLERLVKSK